MRSFKNRIIVLLAILSVLLTSMPLNGVNAASSIKLNQKKVKMEQGEEITLKLEGVSEKAKVKWSVSKKNIVTLENKKKSDCKVTAVKAGSTTVKAKYSGKTYKCKITVVKPAESKTNTDKTIKTSLTFYDPVSNITITREGDYTGETQNRLPDGLGQFKTANANGVSYIIDGNFTKGKMDGTVVTTWYNSDGSIHSSRSDYFENGVYVTGYQYYDGGSTFWKRFDDTIYWEDTSYYDSYTTKTVWHSKYNDGSELYVQDADFIYNTNFISLYSEFSLEELNYVNGIFGQSQAKIKQSASYIEPRKYDKNPGKFENCVDVIKGAYVFDCIEHDTDYTDEPIVTEIYCNDSTGQVYVLYYLGSIDIYKEDTIDVWCTLTGKYSYTSISNNTVKSFTGIAYIAETVK